MARAFAICGLVILSAYILQNVRLLLSSTAWVIAAAAIRRRTRSEQTSAAAPRRSAQLDAGRHWNALNHNVGSPKKVINIRRRFSDSVTLSRVSGSQSPNLKHRARALRQGCRDVAGGWVVRHSIYTISPIQLFVRTPACLTHRNARGLRT
jgi:hypothetical protein